MRQAARQARSAPLVQALRPWLEAQLDLVSQGSALAGAIRYGLRHWDGLCRYLEDGRLEMDTNTIEREIRPVATTRSAALFAGSEGGGDNWAIATTLVRTAILNGVNPQAWLTDVLSNDTQIYDLARHPDLRFCGADRLHRTAPRGGAVEAFLLGVGIFEGGFQVP